jgi:hypothetical protein
VATTVRNCTNITEFLTVRNVTGGAVHIKSVPLPAHVTKEELCVVAKFKLVREGKLARWSHADHVGKLFTTGVAYRLACEQLQQGEMSPVLGKVVRFYIGLSQPGRLAYASNCNKVPDSDNATPLMQIPDTLPTDIDYAWYISNANEILSKLSVDN